MITADDFGFGVATSAGIIHAHLHGPVDRTSVMVVSGDHVKASVQLLEGAPDLKLGLHLVFTDVGDCALAASAASGLVNPQRRFWSIQKLYFRCISAKVDPSAVFDEICAQARRFYELIGRAPTHVDGHHHAHQFPVIRQALLRAMKSGILPSVTRRTVEPPGMLSAVSSCRARRAVLNLLGHSAAADFRREGICVNDFFLGVIGEQDLREENPWERQLAALPQRGSVEWMVHPGFYDESLLARDSYVHGRVRELEALTSPPITINGAAIATRCGEDDDANPATIGLTGSAHGHSSDRRLSFLRGEESRRSATTGARGSAGMRPMQSAAADTSRAGGGE